MTTVKRKLRHRHRQRIQNPQKRKIQLRNIAGKMTQYSQTESCKNTC